jgi:hypothetical protein
VCFLSRFQVRQLRPHTNAACSPPYASRLGPARRGRTHTSQTTANGKLLSGAISQRSTRSKGKDRSCLTPHSGECRSRKILAHLCSFCGSAGTSALRQPRSCVHKTGHPRFGLFGPDARRG